MNHFIIDIISEGRISYDGKTNKLKRDIVWTGEVDENMLKFISDTDVFPLICFPFSDKIATTTDMYPALMTALNDIYVDHKFYTKLEKDLDLKGVSTDLINFIEEYANACIKFNNCKIIVT